MTASASGSGVNSSLASADPDLGDGFGRLGSRTPKVGSSSSGRKNVHVLVPVPHLCSLLIIPHYRKRL